jgi:secreted PhoX family phosphatase
MTPCGVADGVGQVYIADGAVVRQVNPETDWLTTPAGTGAFAPPGFGGPAAKASLYTCHIAVDHSGNLLIADEMHVSAVAAGTGTFYGQAMTTGHIYSIAGGGTGGLGDGGPATSAELGADGVAVDAAGNVVIADEENDRIRVVAASTGTFYGQAMTAGDIYTAAGNGTTGFSGDGGPATAAELDFPQGVAVDAAGNLVINDNGNDRIRVVAASTGTFYGQAMTAGDIYTIAGDGHHGFSGDGGPATAAELDFPQGLAVDNTGNLLIADFSNRIRVVAASTGTFYGQAMTAGDIYTIAGDGHHGFSGDGGPATEARLNGPQGVGSDAAGNLLIADTSNHRLRVVAASTGTFYGQAMTAGDIYTIAGNGTGEGAGGGTAGLSGDGGLATRAEFSTPVDVVLDTAGNLVIADQRNNRIRVVAATTGTFYGKPMKAKHVYTVAGGGTGGPGDGGPATRARLSSPQGAAVDQAGNLLIADTNGQRIQVVAASTGTFYGQAMTASDIYTVAGTGTHGFSGDGGPAASAELDFPDSVAMGTAGNVLIADTVNGRIRVVAASNGTFYGQAMTAGDIYTVAGNGTAGFSGDGGPGTSAELNSPQGMAVDAAGNLLIADRGNGRIRVVAASTGTFYGQAMTTGHIYTVAGGGTSGVGDGGPATKAEIGPGGVAVDAAGNLVIADSDDNRIRVVAASTGIFYGRHMKAADIYTVAGSGFGASGGFSGDGGPATKAELEDPGAVAVGAAGDLVIADTNNERVREVAG